MKRQLTFFITLLLLLKYACAIGMAETQYEIGLMDSDMQEYETALMDSDIQEDEVLYIMRQELIGQHINTIMFIGGDPDNDEYDPDDDYSYYCKFYAIHNEYGSFRYWYCFAFYHNIPYRGYFMQIDSPSGELSLSDIVDNRNYEFSENDDLRAARESIEEHKELMLAYLQDSADNDQYSFDLLTDKEYLGTWCMSYRVIPITLSSDSNCENAGDYPFYAVIKPEQKNNMFDKKYYWEISVYSKDAIQYYSDTIISSQMIPVFSDSAIYREYIDMI